MANFMVHRYLHIAQQLHFGIACIACASAHIPGRSNLYVAFTVTLLCLPTYQTQDRLLLTAAFAEAGTCQTT